MSSKINLRKKAYILHIVGNGQFIILTIIAMFFYMGGTYINPYTQGYTFWLNYFSDLGRTVAHSGIQNMISWILFTIALSLWGIFQIPFYIAFLKFFSVTKNNRIFYITGSILGIFSGFCYVGIAFTPSDILDSTHDIFVFLGFGSIFLSNILYSIVIYQDDKYSNFYAKILVISVIISGVYFLILFLTRDINFAIKLLFYVLGQKVMFYSLLVCGIIQGYGALKQNR